MKLPSDVYFPWTLCGRGSSSSLLRCFITGIVLVPTNNFTVDHFIKAAMWTKVYPCLRDYSFEERKLCGGKVSPCPGAYTSVLDGIQHFIRELLSQSNCISIKRFCHWSYIWWWHSIFHLMTENDHSGRTWKHKPAWVLWMRSKPYLFFVSLLIFLFEGFVLIVIVSRIAWWLLCF